MHIVLQKLLGDAQCSPTLNTTFPDACGNFSKYRCVSGHIAFLPGSNVAGCSLFTMLRNPADRLISQYFYARTVAQNSGSYFDEKCKEVSFEDFFFSEDELINGAIFYPLIWHYLPLAEVSVQLLSQAEQLSTAKKVLEKRYFFVGLAERMDESATQLHCVVRTTVQCN